jgi:hypothetical protein
MFGYTNNGYLQVLFLLNKPNLTPHNLSIVGADGRTIHAIP